MGGCKPYNTSWQQRGWGRVVHCSTVGSSPKPSCCLPQTLMLPPPNPQLPPPNPDPASLKPVAISPKPSHHPQPWLVRPQHHLPGIHDGELRPSLHLCLAPGPGHPAEHPGHGSLLPGQQQQPSWCVRSGQHAMGAGRPLDSHTHARAQTHIHAHAHTHARTHTHTHTHACDARSACSCLPACSACVHHVPQLTAPQLTATHHTSYPPPTHTHTSHPTPHPPHLTPPHAPPTPPHPMSPPCPSLGGGGAMQG